MLENKACLLGKHFIQLLLNLNIFLNFSVYMMPSLYSFHVNIKLQPHFIRITDCILSLVICWGGGQGAVVTNFCTEHKGSIWIINPVGQLFILDGQQVLKSDCPVGN